MARTILDDPGGFHLEKHGIFGYVVSHNPGAGLSGLHHGINDLRRLYLAIGKELRRCGVTLEENA